MARILPYQPPATPRPNTPGPVWPVVLALPGMICWSGFILLLLARLIGNTWMHRLLNWPFSLLEPLLPPVAVWLSLSGLAAVCAVVSIETYRERPKPWYVRLNLAINMSGLLVSAVVVVLFLLVLCIALIGR